MGKAVKGSPTSSGGKRGSRQTRIGSSHKREWPSPIDHAKGYEVVWPQVSGLFDAARGTVGLTFVYVIGEADGGCVKIGTAKDPVKRLRSMQTGNPRRLRVEYVLMGGRDIEALLHQMWEAFAITSVAKRGKVDAAPGTEWFEPEIREQLFPIMATASEAQIDHLRSVLVEGGKVIGLDELERMIRQAHAEHGFVAKGREEVRLLGAHAGYVLGSRRNRV